MKRRLDLLQTVADSVPVMIWAVDETGSCIYVNQACCDFTGRTAEDFLGDGWLSCIHPEDRERTGESSNLAAAAGGALEVEYRLLGHTGEYRHVLGRGSTLLDDAGAIAGMVGMALDITERRQAEAERLALEESIQRSQKLESLGLMAGGVAHDFNNLLMAIQGHADLALDRLPGGHVVRQSVEEIGRAARRAADLTAQMVAYSGGRQLHEDLLDLSSLVRGSRDLLHSCVSRNVELYYELADPAPEVRGDATALRQVLVNLASNASDAQPTGGRILMRTGTTRVEEGTHPCAGGEVLAPGDYAFLEVRDDGAGIDPGHLGRIFDPFFTTRKTGRGLGLAAAQGIVRGHEGGIEVQSRPGGGTSFLVLLPSRPEARESVFSESGVPARNAAAPLRVLVVDDEETVRRTVCLMVGALGYESLSADRADAGLAIVRERREDIDVVLLDVTMPGPPVGEVVEQLRSAFPDLPVVLTSGYDAEGFSQVASRCQGVLPKPYRLAQLREALRTAAGRP